METFFKRANSYLHLIVLVIDCRHQSDMGATLKFLMFKVSPFISPLSIFLEVAELGCHFFQGALVAAACQEIILTPGSMP